MREDETVIGVGGDAAGDIVGEAAGAGDVSHVGAGVVRASHEVVVVDDGEYAAPVVVLVVGGASFFVGDEPLVPVERAVVVVVASQLPHFNQVITKSM